ncbi:unnamed protein product [Sphagnum balticum]
MKLIGLTGGIATGKSTVSQLILGRGLEVIDADDLAKEVVVPNSFGLRALVQVFGKGILQKTGELDRTALRKKIFEEPQARLVVEAITHPLIQWRAKQEIERLRQKQVAFAFYDASLIFEKNLVDQFDHILVVHTTQDVQLQRLITRDKISKDSALKALGAQWPVEKKMNLAHFLIDNNGTPEKTKEQVEDLLKKLREFGA